MAILLQKRPPEVRLYNFNFNELPEFVNGDTIASVLSVTASIVAGTGNPPSQGAPSIGTGANAGKVFITLVGGDPNITVQYLCKITTVGGSTLECLGYLEILPV